VLLRRVEEAVTCARQALDAGREHGERPYEASALHLLAEVAVARELDGFESVAATHYPEALATSSELGMRPLVAHCHLGLAKLYRRTGTRSKAEDHLATAAAMYLEMGMSFWLEKAETVLRPPRRDSP
jgi:hypothetical protein